MNDVDSTGPLPVIHDEDPTSGYPIEPAKNQQGPVGWIPAGRVHEVPLSSHESGREDRTDGGADPDLPWDFATTPAPELAGPVIPLSDEPAAVAGAAVADDEAVGDQVPPVKPPPRSRHGQPAPLSRAWTAGVAAAIAIAAVVVGIVAFKAASPSPSNAGSGPAFVLPTAAATAAPDAGSSPAPGLAGLPKATGAASGVASAKASRAITSGVPANAPSVTVLNETTTHGLAAAEAEKLRGAGWTVRRVTNINARLTQTTVYYDASQEAAAKALVASVPSVKAALPRPSYVLSTGGLIVVVASDAA